MDNGQNANKLTGWLVLMLIPDFYICSMNIRKSWVKVYGNSVLLLQLFVKSKFIFK